MADKPQHADPSVATDYGHGTDPLPNEHFTLAEAGKRNEEGSVFSAESAAIKEKEAFYASRLVDVSDPVSQGPFVESEDGGADQSETEAAVDASGGDGDEVPDLTPEPEAPQDDTNA